MKNFFLIAFITLACISSVNARETMVPDLSVVIDTGKIEEPALLASPGGEIFIEFSTSTKFVHEEGLISFNGEILPPAIIEIPDQRPKLRMNPLVSFELISDSSEPLLFIDRFDAQNARNTLRDEYLNPESISRSAWVKLIVPIEDPSVGRPQLWEYIGPNDGWAVIGGILDEPSPEGVRVFSAILRRTGVYTIFDEDPAPQHPEDEFNNSMEYAEEMYNEEFWNESNGALPEGMTWEDFQAIAGNDEGNAYREAETPPAISEKDELTTQKAELQSQLAQVEDPQEFRLIQDLIGVLEEKINVLGQKETLLYQKEVIQNSLANATTEEERTPLQEQLSMIDRQLTVLNEDSVNTRVLEAEAALNDFETTPPVVEPSAPKGEIPTNGKLPQTGTEAMNNDEGFSLFFPIALLLVLIVIVASGVVATRRRV